MITIWLREHGTHNSGYSIDKRFELEDYSCPEDMTEELYEYTENWLKENEPKELKYHSNMEEWLITDIEIDSTLLSTKDIGFDEYMSLQLLLDLEEAISDYELEIALILDSGSYGIKEAIEKAESGDITYFEIAERTFMSDNKAFGEYIVDNSEDFGIDIPENLKIYIDTEHLGQEYGYDYAFYTTINGTLYAYNMY